MFRGLSKCSRPRRRPFPAPDLSTRSLVLLSVCLRADLTRCSADCVLGLLCLRGASPRLLSAPGLRLAFGKAKIWAGLHVTRPAEATGGTARLVLERQQSKREQPARGVRRQEEQKEAGVDRELDRRATWRWLRRAACFPRRRLFLFPSSLSSLSFRVLCVPSPAASSSPRR